MGIDQWKENGWLHALAGLRDAAHNASPLHLTHRYNMRLAVVRGIVSLQTPHPNSSQPAMKVRPPTGVTAPNHRIPARDTPYRLPENRRIPRINSHPDF